MKKDIKWINTMTNVKEKNICEMQFISNWNQQRLTNDQIVYRCDEATVSTAVHGKAFHIVM